MLERGSLLFDADFLGFEQFDGVASTDGVLEVGLGGASGAVLGFGIESEKGDLGNVDTAAEGGGVDAANGDVAGFLGGFAGAHGFDNENAAADADDFLADAGSAGGAGGVIDVEAGADDRGVADAAGELVGEAGGGADA